MMKLRHHFWLLAFLATVGPVVSQDYSAYTVLSQPLYTSGDTVFFKTYLLNSETLVSDPVIMNLIVTDEDGRELAHQKFRAEQGVGINQWAIPQDLSGVFMFSFFPETEDDHSTPLVLFKKAVPVVKEKLFDNQPVFGENSGNSYEKLKDEALEVKFRGLPAEVKRRERCVFDLQISANNHPVKAKLSVRIDNSQLYDSMSNSVDIQQFDTKSKLTFTKSIKQSGTVSLKSGKKLNDSTQIMFFLQKTQWRQQMILDESGVFDLWIPDFFYEDVLFFHAKDKKGLDIPDLQIQWNKATKRLIKGSAGITSNESDRNSIYSQFSLRKNLTNQSYGFFGSQLDSLWIKEDQSVGPVSNSVIYMKDYRRFGTMEEYLKEVISTLKVRSAKSGKKIRARIDKPTFNDPLYVIDGYVTKDTEFFLSLDPSLLESVEVLTKTKYLRKYGLMGLDGVVIVNSLKGNVIVPLSETSLPIKGLNPLIPFNNKTKLFQPEAPDIRSTIYWNPSLATSEDGTVPINFFWSDDVGRVKIEVEGVTMSGRRFSTTKYVNVKQ